MNASCSLRLRWVIAGLSLALSGCAAAKLDHFRFYDVDNLNTRTIVFPDLEVRGQFDIDGFKKIKVIKLRYFAPPVGKELVEYKPGEGEGPGGETPPGTPEGEKKPKIDENNHLAWYDTEQEKDDPIESVKARHQFTGDDGTVYKLRQKPIALLVPTQKLDPPMGETRRLSHFKVYEIIEPTPVGATVMLDDQFSTRKHKVLEPMYFAVPVTKDVYEMEGGGRKKKRTFKKGNDIHLTIFKLSDPFSPRVNTRIKNQIEESPLLVKTTDLLAVPTEKLDRTFRPSGGQ